MTSRRAARRALAIASIVCVSGCFKYVPTRLDVTPAGQDVRLTVTRQGAFELGELTEISTAVPELRGSVVRVEDEVVLLLVPLENRRVGFHTEELGQTIRVPEGEILAVERRELDRPRTGLLLAGSAAVAAGIIFLILDSFGNQREMGPFPDEAVVSFPFSLPIGR